LIPKDFKFNDLQVFILKGVAGALFASVDSREVGRVLECRRLGVEGKHSEKAGDSWGGRREGKQTDMVEAPRLTLKI